MAKKSPAAHLAAAHGSTFYRSARPGRGKASFFGNAGVSGSRSPAPAAVAAGQVAWNQSSSSSRAAKESAARSVVPLLACQRAVRTVVADGAADPPVGALELEDDPPHGVPVRDRPVAHWAATISSSRFSSLPQGQRGHDVAVPAVALFRDEAAASVLGVDGPLGVILGEALLPDDLIKRQTHDSFPCPTRNDPLDRARYGSAPGTAYPEYIRHVSQCIALGAFALVDGPIRFAAWHLSGQNSIFGSVVPLYEQAADYVQPQIESGALEPGDRFPDMRKLAEDWGIAYQTVRRAMR